VLEGRADGPVQSPQLVPIQISRRPQRIEAGAPQRLVDVDVPQPRNGALVEQSCLERGAAAREALSETRSGEERVERLVPHSSREIRLCLAGLQQEPGAEAAHVSVRDVGSVVQGHDGTPM
jgi:hypothetical protein